MKNCIAISHTYIFVYINIVVKLEHTISKLEHIIKMHDLYDFLKSKTNYTINHHTMQTITKYSKDRDSLDLLPVRKYLFINIYFLNILSYPILILNI